ncbi:hypothetical protein FRC0405_00519 [Corynebacterium diphtheriae]|nr:hypothetical protein FRC0405_00519 [Corynebacterium diphtheriae]
MILETLKKEIMRLADQDFDILLRWAGGEEYNRRKATPLVNAAQAEVVKALQDEGKLTKPDALTDPEKLPEDLTDVPEWANPGVDHASMYRRGDIVRVGGKIYQSQFDGLNHWQPGATDVLPTIWLDITPLPKKLGPDGREITPGTEGYPIPWRAGLELHEGQYVTESGALYRVLRDIETIDPTHVPSTLLGNFYELVKSREELEFGEDEAWEDPAGGVGDFHQPTGGHDAYPLGKKVRFEGHVWENLLESNGFSPAAYPAGWKKIS